MSDGRFIGLVCKKTRLLKKVLKENQLY